MKFWLGTCLELVAPVQTRRAQGLDLGLARGPQFPPEEVSRAPVFLFVSSTRVGRVQCLVGPGSRLFAWRLSSLEPVATSRRFGFGFGSRLLVSSKRLILKGEF